jgi:CheY-like chemotaxis protein
MPPTRPVPDNLHPGSRILVVDDEQDLREAVKELLEAYLDGARVRTAESGKAALAILDREDIDLIVTDFKMPGMNGVQFLREASKVAPDVPHVLVTAFDREALAALGSDAQGERIVQKPFEPQALVHMVEEALSPA